MGAVREENMHPDPWQEVRKCNRFANQARNTDSSDSDFSCFFSDSPVKFRDTALN
jgi:hypothetical protein